MKDGFIPGKNRDVGLKYLPWRQYPHFVVEGLHFRTGGRVFKKNQCAWHFRNRFTPKSPAGWQGFFLLKTNRAA
ncbi:MAG: hypothetical protein D6714_05190 [Bacteroidetes bacterium]|nr:MAG: hypothetical protein D6714_05190 [Bacteroidota bacterium]